MSKQVTSNVVAWPIDQWLQIVALLKRLAQVPSLTDPAAVRQWVRQLIELAMKLEDRLPEPVMRGVDLLAEMVASDAVWAAFFRLLVYLYSSERTVVGSAREMLVHLNEPEFEFLLGELTEKAAAEETKGQPVVQGFDLTLILQIAAALIQLLKERNNA